MAKQYFVCWGESPEQLQDRVNDAIAKSWQPFGGVSVSVQWSGDEYADSDWRRRKTTFLAQAIVLE